MANDNVLPGLNRKCVKGSDSSSPRLMGKSELDWNGAEQH